MKIHVIIGQRKCKYAGEYGIESIACMSEYEFGDNPDYLMGELDKARKSDEFASVEIIDLEVSEKELTAILFPANKAVAAAVVGLTDTADEQQGS